MVQKTVAMDLREVFPSYCRARSEKELDSFANVSGGQRPFAWELAANRRSDDTPAEAPRDPRCLANHVAQQHFPQDASHHS